MGLGWVLPMRKRKAKDLHWEKPRGTQMHLEKVKQRDLGMVTHWHLEKVKPMVKGMVTHWHLEIMKQRGLGMVTQRQKEKVTVKQTMMVFYW